MLFIYVHAVVAYGSCIVAMVYGTVRDDDDDNNIQNACSISYTLLARPATDNIVLKSVPVLRCCGDHLRQRLLYVRLPCIMVK